MDAAAELLAKRDAKAAGEAKLKADAEEKAKAEAAAVAADPKVVTCSLLFLNLVKHAP